MTAIDSVQRRHFIKGLAASGLILAASPTLFSCSSYRANRYVSAATNHAGEHFIVAFDELGNLQSQVKIANRGHDLVKIDEHRVVAFSRRPFTTMFVIDLSDNQLEKTIEAEKGYHFYGHGVFDSKRGWLITTENHIDSSQGMIVVRDSQDFTIIKRYKSGGIGPHQCAMVPNTDLLVVANGGIQTHPDSGRKKLNLESMRPNLSYLDLETGEIKEQVVPPHFQLSLRHLAVAKSGEVIVAAQFQGHYRQQLPLVFSHKRGEQLVALPGSNVFWQMFDHYIASVAN